MLASLATWIGIFGGLSAALAYLSSRQANFSRRGNKRNVDSAIDAASSAGAALFLAADQLDCRIFGKKLFSRRTLILSVILTLLIFNGLTINDIRQFWGFYEFTVKYDLFFQFFYAFNVWIAFIIGNLVMDFVSLCQTRMVLHYIKRKPCKTAAEKSIIACMILFDTIISLLIFVLTALFSWYFAHAVEVLYEIYSGSDPSSGLKMDVRLFLRELPQGVVSSFALEGNLSPLFPSAVTSLTTSIWIWIYMIGWGFGSLFGRADRLPVNVLQPAATGCAVVALLGAIVIPILYLVGVFPLESATMPIQL